MKRTILSAAISLALCACGGGGGGVTAPSADPPLSTVPFYTPTAINHFTPIVAATSYKPAGVDIFTKDLNGDKVDEVIVSSVAFQNSATPATWKNANLQIYGFNTGSFKNETNTWLNGTDNQYLGGTTVKFGDFNGDGLIDMFAANFTDNPNVTGPMPVFFNTGKNSFIKSTVDFGNVNAHDSIVADLNGDGYADIIVPDINGMRPAVAFGSKSGAFTVYRSDSFGGGAGISVADYLGNGTKTIVLTDAPYSNNGGDDTRLFSWNVVDGKLVLTKIADLPPDRFTLPKWAAELAQSNIAPHAIRNITMDFDNDGLPDVVVFSTLPKNGNTHGYSEVQFLKNNGGGKFTDVTDTVLAKYDNNKTTTYNPVLIDVNNDGLMDILISATDYTGQASTSVLLATKEGKFVESYAQVFTAFANQTNSMTTNAGTNQRISIVAGPDGKRYLMTVVETTDSSGIQQMATYLSLIGSTGTVTAQASVAVLQQTWPWLTTAQANEILSKSTTTWINGIPVIDLDAIMNPVGPLAISLNGRTGTRIPIAGSLSIPGMNPSLLNNLQAVDTLNRNFTVNLAGMAPQPLGLPVKYNLYSQDVTQNWSSRFTAANSTMPQADHYNIGGDVQYSGDDSSGAAWSFTNRSFGINLDSPWVFRAGMSTLPNGNPWFNMSGMFGTIRSTYLYDFNATRFYQNGMFGQLGLMKSIVDFKPGLVEDITPMWLAYTVAGWRQDGFTAYAGIQPTVFDGEVKVKLPTFVDNRGTMHYTQHNVAVRNPLVSFAGVDHTWNFNKSMMASVGAVINDRGASQAKISFSFRF